MLECWEEIVKLVQQMVPERDKGLLADRSPKRQEMNGHSRVQNR